MCERVKTCRAMRYARGDKTVLHGFDQNAYAKESNANRRHRQDILDEYSALRRATLLFFQSLEANDFMRRGTAGRSEPTARAAGYLVLGHEIHHRGVFSERYLGN